MKDFMIKHKSTLIKWLIAIIIVLSLILYATFKIKFNKNVYTPRPPYDQSEFIEAKDYDEDHVFNINNDRFDFNLNVSDTKFSIKDNITTETWNSNPVQVGATYPSELNELFVIYYERQLETPKSLSIFTESVGNKDYAFRKFDDGLDILYRIGRDDKLTMIDLPREMSVEKFETLIIEPLELLVKEGTIQSRHLYGLKSSYYKSSDAVGTVVLGNLNTQDSINIYYDLIFNKSDYTKDDYVEDSLKYNFPTVDERPYFEFVVSYKIDKNGLEVTIINDSIVESEKYQVAYIDVLPYFGSNNMHDEGLTVIPDGSGILINHTNGKYNNPTYDKRIYGQDMSVGSQREIMPEEQETIKMPMYGYTKNGNGFINVLEQSDAMASLRSGFTNTRSSGTYTNIVPFAHFRYIIRERDAFTFESSESSQRVSTWTKEYNKEDYKARYIFGKDTKTYYDIAELYQSYLVETFNLEKTVSDKILHLTMLGGYKELKHFIGFPYDSIQTLTKATDIALILDQIEAENNKVAVSYKGWSNEGIMPTAMHKIKYNKNITTKKLLKKVEKELKEQGIDLFLEVNTNNAYTNKKIKLKRDVTKDIFQKPVIYYKYDQATLLADKTTMKTYRLKSSAQSKVYNTINKLSYENIVLSDEAQNLSTDFTNGKVLFRDKLIESFNTNIESLDKNVILRNPNLYGLLKTDKILDMPISGTSHRMIDYEIPFIQLVFNGYVNYTNPAVNLDTSKSIAWHKLKAIETGSRVQFTLSYKDTVNLIKTEYSNYYSTFYKNWIHEINDVVSELDNLDIYNAVIVSHKTLNAQGTKVEVIYSNNKVFTIDYESNTFTEGSVTI